MKDQKYQRNKKSLLIVEDDIQLRMLVREIMSDTEISVFDVSNGVEALEILKNQIVDAIVSDIRMPIMDGLKLLTEVRALGRNTPFVFLTAQGDKQSIQEAIRNKPFAFIEKPFEPDDLHFKLRRAIDQGYLLRS